MKMYVNATVTNFRLNEYIHTHMASHIFKNCIHASMGRCVVKIIQNV